MRRTDRKPRRRPRRLGRAFLLVTLAAVAGCGALAGACAAREPDDWEAVKQKIRERFPGAPQLTTADLDLWLHDSSRQTPLLLDARAPEEYAVSHLDGAVLAPGEEAARAVLAGVPRDRPVVVYCSVGWRSSQLAESLRADGYEQVYNLEGSLFQWANEGRPVFRDGRRVEAVHPYDEDWGRLLDRKLWALEPR